MDGILVINKPQNMTSHDVIDHLRKKYNQKKFGHTGTLDPNATGVLVVLCGKACKALQFLSAADKEYIATMALGTSYSSDDIWGEAEAKKPITPIADLQKELNCFLGTQQQRVPKTSAKKVGGKKLLDYQREQKEVPVLYNEITIYALQALADDPITFKVSCSSGTYVRSICRDLAIHTNNLGALSSLVRTRVGSFVLDQAEDLDKEEHTLYPLEMALSNWEKVEYSPIEDVYHGKRIQLDSAADQVCILDQGKVVAIYEREKGPLFKSKRGLW